MKQNKSDDNPFVKNICKEVVSPWDVITKKLSKSLGKRMAHDIKEWRIGRGIDDPSTHSWRSLATVFQTKYPEFSEKNNIVSGNQISGMLLCEAAMMKLEETPDKGWE